MSYTAIPISEKAPQIVRNFLVTHVDMQFGDVHTMLRLPQHEMDLHAGCNLSSASWLCSVVSGLSRIFYAPGKSGNAGSLFKSLLNEYYPWDQEIDGVGRDKAGNYLYDAFRNPLTHTLAIGKKSKQYTFEKVAVVKTSYTEKQIEEVEQSTQRPSWLPPTLEEYDGVLFLNVISFYWGVRTMVRRVSDDPQRIEVLAKFLEANTQKRAEVSPPSR